MESSILTSWISYDTSEEIFPIQNLPFGVCFIKSLNAVKCCSRISNYVIDLHQLEINGLLDTDDYKFNKEESVFGQKTLNAFMALGRPVWVAVRHQLTLIFKSDSDYKNNEAVKNALFDIKEVEMRLPAQIGDYTDFYSSKNHAFNLGSILRGPNNALQENWTHLPVGYHGNYR